MSKKEWILIFGITTSLIVSRLIPHAPNFTSSLAGFLFGAVVIRKNIAGFVLLFGYFLADLVINNMVYPSDTIQWLSSGFEWFFTSFLIIFFANKLFTAYGYNPTKIIGLSIMSSLIFFVFSNFAVWVGSILYSSDLAGLSACFIAAIPFFMNELAGTLFYSCMFFGVYWIYEYKQLKSAKVIV